VLDEVTVLQGQIKQSLTHYKSSPVRDTSHIQSEIEKLKIEETSYNTQFEEEESKIQAMGGKTRKQTLQEFVLFFFYLSFGLFIVSVVVYMMIKETSKKATHVAIALSFLLFIITGILIRYA
jgi:hypothetical protein